MGTPLIGIKRAGIGVVIVLAAVGVPAGAAAAAHSTATTQGLNYVALGDSYAAGLGLTPLTGTPDPSCGQATVDYPHQVAAALGLHLTDVSCSGATTADITGAQRSSVPAQAGALSAATSVVSVTIGGNDLGFAQIARSCIALSPAGPLAASQNQSCKPLYVSGSTDSLQARIANVVVPNLRATFAAIKAAAPTAKVFVVGYPHIMPATVPTTGCYSSPATPNSFPFEAGDTAYLYSVEQSLDAAIQSEATTAGFAYVPAYTDSADHSACATAATAYVNGVTADPHSPTFVTPGSLHPNAAGVASLTAQLSSAVSAAFPAPAPVATSAPAAATTAAPVLAQTGVDATLEVGIGISAIAVIAVGLWLSLYSRKRVAGSSTTSSNH